MINLSCRNYNLIIDGLDCTTALTEINGNYDHYQSGTGYVKISANLTLKRPAYNWTESLDHRTNNRWMRGKEIAFQIANESGVLIPCPVLGKLYILTASFDGNITLNLTAGCILNLLDFRTPSGDGVCFDPGTSTSINSLINELLDKAGIPTKSITTEGSISNPLPKLSNESYIQLAGKLSYSRNYLLYQDNSGVVKSKKISTKETNIINLIVGQHELKYEPLNGNETPSEIYKVSGTQQKIINVTQTESTIEKQGIYADPESGTYFIGLIERITEYEDQINGRKVISETKIERLAGLCSSRFQGDLGLITAEKITLTKKYESESYATKCSDTDNGGLLTSEELIQSPGGMLFEQFYNKLEELAEANNETILINGERTSRTAKETTITYRYSSESKEYDLLEESSGTYQLGKVSKVTKTLQPKGVMGVWEAMTEPEEFDMWIFFNPSELITSEIIEEIWTELSPNQWEYIRTHSQASYLAYPSETVAYMNTLREQDVTILSYDFFWNLRTIEHQKSRSFTANQPPSQEYFPTPEQTIETQIIEIEEYPSFTSDYQAKIKEITIDAGMLTSNQQARDIAELEANITWGKYRGNSCTTALFDEFLSLSPLDGCSWLETTGYKHSFLIDGFSIAFESNQIAVSFDGIWTGQDQVTIVNETQTIVLHNGHQIIETEIIPIITIDGDNYVVTIGEDVYIATPTDNQLVIVTPSETYVINPGGEIITVSNGELSETLIPVLQVLGLPNRYSLKGSSKNKGYFNHYWYNVNYISEYSLIGQTENLGYFNFNHNVTVRLNNDLYLDNVTFLRN